MTAKVILRILLERGEKVSQVSCQDKNSNRNIVEITKQKTGIQTDEATELILFE